MAAAADDRVASVRAFNRFYTGVIGVLGEGLLDTPYSLTEARVVFELAQRDATELAELRRALGVDAGYLSRMLARFEADGIATRERSSTDGRRQVVRLTKAGRKTFRLLDQRAVDDVRALLAQLPEDDQRRLVGAMDTIRGVLEGASRDETLVLRPPEPGDFGWIIGRNAAVYADQYGWDESYETLVARIVADHLEHHDPRRERAWIAEVGGEPVGAVLCVRKDDDVAQLRLLLVEPGARGLGIGTRLVDECLRFARRAGYARIMLWTNDVLADARRIYERAGFELVEEEPHRSFGHDLVGQIWTRSLATAPAAP
ncbi:MAG: bifunctional helix-turn-helix transcriptional regulator/GNAT family N-acetyltransferase [Acidimicrobiia bacterium]